MRRQITTTRGYALLDVASALQKAIRRADARLAGYWAIELFESGFREYLWRRLLTVSAEDCWGVITHEIEALYRSWQMIDKQKQGAGRIFASKAVLLLALARKCRDADHLTNLVYDPKAIDEGLLQADLAAARESVEPIPDYAFDVHTPAGRRAGKTKRQFFQDEFKALAPREPGLFDADVETSPQKTPLGKLPKDCQRLDRRPAGPSTPPLFGKDPTRA
jgi:replication-associated recombination protein RarA